MTYIAKDANGDIFAYTDRPRWSTCDGAYYTSGLSVELYQLDEAFLPELKPGMCFRLVMADLQENE